MRRLAAGSGEILYALIACSFMTMNDVAKDAVRWSRSDTHAIGLDRTLYLSPRPRNEKSTGHRSKFRPLAARRHTERGLERAVCVRLAFSPQHVVAETTSPFNHSQHEDILHYKYLKIGYT